MPIFISVKELEDGYKGFPKIPKESQVNIRAKRQIEYTKICGKVHYTEDALQAYAERNKVEAK